MVVIDSSNQPGWGASRDSSGSSSDPVNKMPENQPGVNLPAGGDGTYIDPRTGQPLTREQAMAQGVIDKPTDAGTKLQQIDTVSSQDQLKMQMLQSPSAQWGNESAFRTEAAGIQNRNPNAIGPGTIFQGNIVEVQRQHQQNNPPNYDYRNPAEFFRNPLGTPADSSGPVIRLNPDETTRHEESLARQSIILTPEERQKRALVETIGQSRYDKVVNDWAASHSESFTGPNPGESGYQDQYWAIHKQDAPRSDLGGKIFAGGSPLGKFLEAIQSPGLAYEYVKYDINSIMGKSPSDIGIHQARESFLETVYTRRENYGLPGAAAIGVAESLPVQAAAGGALFKGGTLAARVGLRGAAGAVGSNIVARGLLFGERAVEPLTIAGGLGIAGKELVTTYQTEGGTGAAAQGIIMAGSLPFAMAGWKGTGNLYSKAQTVGRTEVPAPVSQEVLTGKHTFPTTEPGTTQNEVIAGFKTDEGLRGYHATSESMGKEVTIANAPSRPSDVGGLYVSPHKYGSSPYFLRVNAEYGGGIADIVKGLGQSEPLNPTVMDIQLQGVGRLPKNIRGNINAAKEFMGGSAEPGKAYLTPKLENTLRGGGAAEAEAVVSPGTTLGRSNQKLFFKFKGRNIPIDEYAATSREVAATTPKTIKSVSETGNYGYQRTTIPPVSSNVARGLNMPTLSGTARAEPSKDDYTTAYNAAREAARQQTYGNDITTIHEPQSPGKVDTIRGKKQAEDLADTIMNDLRGGGMNVRYNKRTAIIEKVPDSFNINKGPEPILDINYFNKAKDQQSTAFTKGFQSEDLTGMNILSFETRRSQQVGDLSILAKYYGNNPADVPILFPDVEFGGRSKNFDREMRYRKARQTRENIRQRPYRPDMRPYRPPGRTDRISRRSVRTPSYTPDYRPSGRPERTTSYTPDYIPTGKPDVPPPWIPTYKKKSGDEDVNTAEIKIKNKFFKTSRKSPIAAASIDMRGLRKAMRLTIPKRRRRK